MSSDRSFRHQSRFRMSVVLPILLLMFIGFGFGEEYLRNKEIEHQIAQMQAENARLDADRLSSLRLIDTLSQSYYVESEARQRGMGNPGEQLIIVEDMGTSRTGVSPILSHDDVPNPLRWYEYFFDHDAFLALTNV